MGPSRRLQVMVLLTDALVVSAATLFGFSVRFSVSEIQSSLTGPIQWVGTLIPILWITLLVLVGAYDRRVLGLGLTEYGRVVKSALWVIGVIGTVSFLGKFDTSRAYVLITVPVGLGGVLVSRWLWRRLIISRRNRGRLLQPTIIVGDTEDCSRLRESFEERPWAGYAVAGTLTAGALSVDDVVNEVTRTGATCIALTSSSGFSGSQIRDLSWRIEGWGIDLLMSSNLGAVAGPRMTLRVATGLPLLHLDEVGLTLSQRMVKRSLDLVGASLLTLLIAPLLFVIAGLIAVTSGRPVFFRQWRVGRDGEPFLIWKFRTMTPDADSQRESLRSSSIDDGPIVKFRDDPRVTPFGHFLRRWSLDELPQLFNVIRGSMSLVGPRPHPLDDFARYRGTDARRLLTKPGMTGLGQVAGRSDLSWQDTLELDLLYIENWSIVGDLTILARTVQAVISRQGAY